MATRVLTVAAWLLLASAQSGVAQPVPVGSRVRLQTERTSGEWRLGRLSRVGPDTLILLHDGLHTAYPMDDVVAFQRWGKSGRGAVMGSAIGGVAGLALGTGIPLLAEVPSGDVAGYAVFGAAGGLVVGAALGTGRAARRASVVGLLAGAGVGTLALSGVCEQDSPPLCPVVWGGGFGAIGGVILGSVVGLLLPDWIRVSPMELASPSPH